MIIWKKWLDGCLNIYWMIISDLWMEKLSEKKIMWETQCHTQLPVGKKCLQHLTTHWLRLWGWFLGKKKAGKPVNPLVHWWSFSQGLVYFRAVPVQQPPEKQKKCRKVFIPCPKYCQINCSNLFGVTVITHGLKSCLVWKKTKTTLIIQWRRPTRPNDGKVPWLNPKNWKMCMYEMWLIHGFPQYSPKTKQQNPVLDIMFINRLGFWAWYNMVFLSVFILW